MDVKSIIKISGGEASFVDTYGQAAAPPGITFGVITRLILDLRDEDDRNGQELPPIPLAALADCDSYYIAIDNDWSQETVPKLTRTSGISVVEEDGRTLLKAELPNTAAVPALAEAIEQAAAKSITLHCEVGGVKAGVGDVFAYSFDLIIRNRVWLPDGSPEDLPSDPDYLNTAQVTAYINATVAEALEDIQGDPGPPPTIAIGTVSSGDAASATLTPGAEPGKYTLNLVLPKGSPGEEGGMPALGVGTVTEGAAAAAEIVSVEGGYAINLTIPRGLPGAGVTPSGIWAEGTTYALNDAVRHAGGWWRSLQDSNVGHAPPVDTEGNAWWEIIVKDGADAEPFLRVYNSTDDTGDPNWHATLQPGDTHFRDSIDGGVSWTEPALISLAQEVIVLFNPDEATNWKTLAPGPVYSTGAGKYMRARQAGGAWGAAYEIHELESQPLRVQFSSGGASPTWHATLQPGDTLARFYNVDSTIDETITISNGTFDVVEIQLCPLADPWHAAYAPGDRFWKISIDGGATYSQPIPLYGKSTYEEWLAAGNTGAPEEFLDSLKGKDGDDGAPGEGLRIDQADTFERRHLCDSAPQGFIFLATDILVDDAEREYQAFYIKRTVAQGDWSDPVRLYPGSPGKTGAAGTVDIGEVSAGIAPEVRNSGTPSAAVLDFVLPVGPPGPGAVPVPDYEFTHADIVGGGLTISGVNPIAAVELYDAEGNGISIERGDAAGTDKCMVRTCYPENHTVVYFGTGLDTTHGGRVRFAQGLSGASLFQIWKANYGNESSTEADYLEWLRGQNSWLDFTDADVTDGVAFLPVTVPVVSVVTSNGNCYPVEKGCLTPAVGGWNLNLAPYLAYDNAPAFAGTWKVGLAAGTVASIVIHQGSAPNGVYQPRLANGNLHYLSLTRDTTILAPVRLRSNETLAVEVLTNRHYVTVKGKRFSGTRLLVTFWQGFAGARATVDSIL